MKTLSRWIHELLLRAPAPLRWTAVNLYGFFLARERFGGDFPELSRRVLESQQWEPEVMQRYQMEQLRRVLGEAAAHVPYYRDIFRERRLAPDDFQQPEDLAKLPELTKDDIRRAAKAMLHERLPRGKSVWQASSGTTGQKLNYLLPRQLAYRLNAALMWRAYGWAGISLGARRATLGGRWFTRRPPYWVRNHAENQLLLSIHHLDETTADDYIDRIQRFAPQLLQGQPNGIHVLARRILARGVRLQIKAVSTTGENLEPFQRSDIEEAFGTRVFEHYGLGESVVAAHQCEHGRFHEACELGITEFVRDDATGLYRILGTSIWNDAMPFIRYRIDDLVELETDGACVCGRHLPVRIRSVVGRVDDVIQAVDGRPVLPVTVRMSINPHLEQCESYQVQQNGPGQYAFVSTAILGDDRRRRFQAALRAVLGQQAQIAFQSGQRVISAGGKIRTVVDLRGRDSA